jgi:hypothetical protein
MLVDLCERVWLVVRVRVDHVITDDDAREALSTIVLATPDGIRVCDLVDIGGAERRWAVWRFSRHYN